MKIIEACVRINFLWKKKRMRSFVSAVEDNKTDSLRASSWRHFVVALTDT